MGSVELVVGVLVLATLLGLVWRARNGRFRAAPPRSADTSAPSVRDDAVTTASAGDVLVASDLGTALGERATFVQFSSEVCSACRSTHRVLAGLASDEPGVVHVDLDVAEHLDLVRRFGVMRTPTTLVVAPDGTVVGRMSGGTDRRQALAALDSCRAAESCRTDDSCPDVALAR